MISYACPEWKSGVVSLRETRTRDDAMIWTERKIVEHYYSEICVVYLERLSINSAFEEIV